MQCAYCTDQKHSLKRVFGVVSIGKDVVADAQDQRAVTQYKCRKRRLARSVRLALKRSRS